MNSDISEAVKAVIKKNLEIDEIIDGTEFDARVEVDPGYYAAVHLTGRRVLVLRPLTDTFDRDSVDLVVLFHLGLMCVEYNKFGPPGFTLPLENLRLHRLLNGK